MSSFFTLITPHIRSLLLYAIHGLEHCPVCRRSSLPYDSVDFNKCCTEPQGKFLRKSGKPVVYYRCFGCGFCFAPEIAGWSQDKFAELIYNADYAIVDPDYLGARPKHNAQVLAGTFSHLASSFRHLDYGGGKGLLSQSLSGLGWQSQSYDPFVDRETHIDQLGKFGLITAYEVFEHAPDPGKLMQDIASLLAPDGVLLFSTLLSDGHLIPGKRLTWWYASPRNGHISLFSRQSLVALANDNGFRFGSFSDASHCMWRQTPAWAAHILPPGS